MIFRAVFFVGLVWFLMPHEPDLGFGRPGGIAGSFASAAPASIETLIQAGASAGDACKAHQEACAGSLSILDSLQGMAVRSLDQVRADIEAHRAKR